MDQIAYNNTAAWITSSSVQLTGQTTNLAQPAQANLTQAKSGAALKVTTNTMTNLRNAAGMNAPSVEKLDKGTELTVTKQQDDWYQVTAPDGKSGYVASWTVTAPNNGQTQKRQRNYPKPRLFWIPDMVVQTRVRQLTIIMITKKPIP